MRFFPDVLEEVSAIDSTTPTPQSTRCWAAYAQNGLDRLSLRLDHTPVPPDPEADGSSWRSLANDWTGRVSFPSRESRHINSRQRP